MKYLAMICVAVVMCFIPSATVVIHVIDVLVTGATVNTQAISILAMVFGTGIAVLIGLDV